MINAGYLFCRFTHIPPSNIQCIMELVHKIHAQEKTKDGPLT